MNTTHSTTMPRLLNCGHMSSPTPYTPGYATMGDGYTLCYACDAQDVVGYLMARQPTISLYLHGDGKHVTTWPGGLVGRVTRLSTARNGSLPGTRTYIRVRDYGGRTWWGVGPGPGMHTTLRRSKKG